MDQVFAPYRHATSTNAQMLLFRKKVNLTQEKRGEGKREKVCKFDYINTFPLHSFIYNKYIY